MKYKKHIFICTNDRGDYHPRKSCGYYGGLDIRKKLVRLINESDLKCKLEQINLGVWKCAKKDQGLIYIHKVIGILESKK